MNDLAWAVSELVVFAVDVAGIAWYLNKMLLNGKTPAARAAAGGVLMFAYLSACYFLAVPDYIRLPAGAGVLVTYAWVTYRRPAGQTIFHALASLFILGASDAIVMFLLSMLPGIDLGMIVGRTTYRLHAMIFAKMLFWFLVFFFSMYKSISVKSGAYWVMVIFPPAISMVMLAALMQFGTMVPGADRWSLIIISLGIFVMNAVLLTLHARLSLNTWMLVEKEKMLRQAELQNIYFYEALTASDNLRGFRHDLKNHLQVLSGLLEMNNVQKARDYLAEIGAFISNNDVTINCGHPMVDAVLGSKVALAKRLGVDIVHTVSLGGDIAMEPMDLCSILGNLADNAIEACTRVIGAGRQRRIELCLNDGNGDLSISFANTMNPDEPRKKRPSLFQKDGNERGIGLFNVKKTVKKYSGTIKIDQAQGEFTVNITIPKPARGR